jgi:hypothetical protein
MKDLPTSVYVFAANGQIKIGMSINVEGRLRGIQFTAPVEVELVSSRTFPDRRTAGEAERSLHRTFAAHRKTGEWFAIGADEAKAALHALPEPPPVVRAAPVEPAMSAEDDWMDAALRYLSGTMSKQEIARRRAQVHRIATRGF